MEGRKGEEACAGLGRANGQLSCSPGPDMAWTSQVQNLQVET